jgi:hypothetical protein
MYADLLCFLSKHSQHVCGFTLLFFCFPNLDPFDLYRNGGVIDLTPWILSVPASLILFALYNYVQG